jgi:hypothetical protein
VLGVLQEGDLIAGCVIGMVGCTGEGLDAGGIESRHGGTRECGEEEGAAVHTVTVCRAGAPRVEVWAS